MRRLNYEEHPEYMELVLEFVYWTDNQLAPSDQKFADEADRKIKDYTAGKEQVKFIDRNLMEVECRRLAQGATL